MAGKSPYTRDELIGELKRVSNEMDGYLSANKFDEIEDTDPESVKPYRTQFDSWTAAKKAAGLKAFHWKRDPGVKTGKEYYNEAKLDAECTRCGENFHGSLDFHHINPEEKEHYLGSHGQAPETLREEMKKCVVLCRNCHAKHHHDEHAFEASTEDRFSPPPVLKDGSRYE